MLDRLLVRARAAAMTRAGLRSVVAGIGVAVGLTAAVLAVPIVGWAVWHLLGWTGVR